MLLHQDFVQLCNRGTFNSNFLSQYSDFAVCPWKEGSGTATQVESFPWEKRPARHLCCPSSTSLPAILDSKGSGKKGVVSGLYQISTFTFSSLARPHQPASMLQSHTGLQATTWEKLGLAVKDFPFLRHGGKAVQKLLCLQQDVCKH